MAMTTINNKSKQFILFQHSINTHQHTLPPNRISVHRRLFPTLHQHFQPEWQINEVNFHQRLVIIADFDASVGGMVEELGLIEGRLLKFKVLKCMENLSLNGIRKQTRQ